MAERTFVLSNGSESHSYTITRHRGSEGMPLCQHLLALVIEPIAAGLGPVAVAAFSSKGLDGVLDNPAVLGALDFGAVARGVRNALLSLPAPTILSVLRYTNRDGKPLVAEDGRATKAFDEAYAGNYAELGKVLWEACSYNGFFPGLDTFESAGKALLARTRATRASGA